MTGLALAGAGIVAELYAKAIERGTSARFTGVFDPNTAAAKRFTQRLGGRAFESLDDMLFDPATEAVVVLSPTSTHADVAARCLKARKHVLIEKPVAESIAEIERLDMLAKEVDRVCMPAHNYIYSPGMERAKRLAADGSLGTIASVWMLYNIFHREDVAARYGGVLREVAIHHAYTLLYLLGRPQRVMAARSRVHYRHLPYEDQAMLLCEMPGGALAHLWVSFAASDQTGTPWTVVHKILGVRGSCSLSWSDAIFENLAGPAWGIPSYVDSFWAELTFFLDHAIRTRTPPRSTLTNAAEALQIIEAAERSITAGGAFQDI
jgi:predicted dehydrogenase